MTVAIRNAQRRAILAAFTDVEDWSALRAALMTEHREILDAISAGDAGRASRLAARHIRNAYDSLPTCTTTRSDEFLQSARQITPRDA